MVYVAPISVGFDIVTGFPVFITGYNKLYSFKLNSIDFIIKYE